MNTVIELRPSASPIWTKCALASRLIAMASPQPEGDPAREGTCAAWVAEMVLRREYPDAHAMIGVAHENGWVVDIPMAYHIQRYVDMLRAKGGSIVVERKVRLNEYIAGTPDAFGRLIGARLFVDDLKYGYDIVEPTTPQIVIYAGAVMRWLERIEADPVTHVTLGIYQPRGQHALGIHRTRTITVHQLEDEVNAILAAGAAAQRPDAVATPGAHCRYCDGAAFCDAVGHEIYSLYSRMQNGAQREMTPQELALELEFVEVAEAMFKGRRDAIRAEASARADRGEQIPGWMRQQGYGQRRFKVSAAVVKSVTGIDPTSGKMVTPAELERQGANPDVVKALVETPRTKASWAKVPDGYYAAMFGEK